jgi:hypothetical protein
MRRKQVILYASSGPQVHAALLYVYHSPWWAILHQNLHQSFHAPAVVACALSGAYRESLIVLDEYSATHGIPPRLKADMKGHLRLHFSTSDYRDEAVLGVFPTTIKRRTLRHLYNAPLHSCWLFGGAKQKFLDALLLGARVELFGPKVSGWGLGSRFIDTDLISLNTNP